MSRALSALVAVALVVGAVVLRARIERGPSGSGEDRLEIVCGSDLRDVCEALAATDDSLRVVVEDEAATTDRLAGSRTDELGVDAWLAAGPWAEIVADNRVAAGVEGTPVTSTSGVLARSPATIVARQDRAAVLERHCGPAGVTWSCVGELAGRPWADAGGPSTWGVVRPGLAPPETGAGLVVLSQAVSSRTQAQGLPVSWARNDLDDPVVSDWFDQLAGQAKRAGASFRDPLARFLVAPATFGAVGAVEARSGPAVARAATGDDLRVIYPEPVVTADVTLSSLGPEPADRLLERIGRDRLLDALVAAGWRIDGRSPTSGVDPETSVGDDSGLPSPGALQYLRQRWQAVS